MTKNISIIGFGNIGKFICGILLRNKKHHFNINVIDTDWQVHGALLDFEHGLEIFHNHDMSFNDEKALDDADFIFHCAGASVPRGKSRLVTCHMSIEITEAIFQNFKPKKEPFIFVVANPVEIISFITHRITGIPKEKIIGTGTYLDSLRMDHAIRKTNRGISDIRSILLGEHGTSVFLSEQLSTVNGEPIRNLFSEDTIEELMNSVKAAAEEIKQTQEATIYGVSYCAVHLFETILNDEKIEVPVSTCIPEHIKKELNTGNMFLSLHSNISSFGASSYVSYIPNEKEIQCLQKSVDLIAPLIPRKYV